FADVKADGRLVVDLRRVEGGLVDGHGQAERLLEVLEGAVERLVLEAGRDARVEDLEDLLFVVSELGLGTALRQFTPLDRVGELEVAGDRDRGSQQLVAQFARSLRPQPAEVSNVAELPLHAADAIVGFKGGDVAVLAADAICRLAHVLVPTVPKSLSLLS